MYIQICTFSASLFKYTYMYMFLTLLASFFLPSHLSFKNMYILGLVLGVIGGFITPAFSFILS